jgi:hypothetical protein
MGLIKPISYWQQPIVAGAVVPAVTPLPRLAVSSSLYAYYDFAFTSSYSQSGQVTVFDLSGNNNTGSVNGTLNFQPITSGSTALTASMCLMQPANNDTNNVQMRAVTLGNTYSMVCTYYIKNPLYSFNYNEIMVGRDPGEAYGFLSQNGVNSQRLILSNNDTLSTNQTPTLSANTGSWHISQMSFNDTTNVFTFCADGVTGSFTLASATTLGATITPRWNSGGNNVGFDPYLGSGSMVQVMAYYTGSLTADEMVLNHLSLKDRYL